MDRIVLLTLLVIPILVGIRVALVRQPIGGFRTAAQDEDRVQMQARWQSPERMIPVHFVVEHRAERGS
jgi:hypothetical protein